MTEEERKDYLKYIENYTINDLADIFNTQNFVIQDKDKFNEILLYYHFKQNEEIEQLQQENKRLYKTIEELSQYEYDREEDYFKYYIQGSDHYLIPKDVFDELFDEMEQLQQENQSLKKENKILRENAEHNDKVVDKVNWENLKLKKELEEYKRLGFKHLNDKRNKLENQQKEFVEWLTNEKDRLSRECSPTYKYSLGKTRFVNEDIYDEVDKILSKYKESCK